MDQDKDRSRAAADALRRNAAWRELSEKLKEGIEKAQQALLMVDPHSAVQIAVLQTQVHQWRMVVEWPDILIEDANQGEEAQPESGLQWPGAPKI